MKKVNVGGKTATVKLITVGDLSMIQNTTKALEEKHDPQLAGLIAHLMHGLADASFELSEEGIKKLPLQVAQKLLEEVNAYNSPLEETPAEQFSD